MKKFKIFNYYDSSYDIELMEDLTSKFDYKFE